MTPSLLSAIFDRNAETRLSVEDEKEALQLAKLGDSKAKETILLAYAPAIRSGVSWYTRTLALAAKREELDDVRMEAILAVLEAVQAHDAAKSDRLAGIVASYVRDALASLATSSAAFAVPERTMKRFSGILREAEGDVEKALELAPGHEMKPETFLAVLAAVRNVESSDAMEVTEGKDGVRSSNSTGDRYSLGFEAQPLSGPGDAVADVEDRILVEAAFRAVDERERNVVQLHYGFADYDTVPDAEIGNRLGMSRPAVQRVRTSALGKMRSALGVA